MKAILFDMDGVLYEGERPVPGAARTLTWCRERAIPFRFLTNTTSRPRAALVAKLADMGITAEVDEIVTPPVAANDWLHRHVDGPVAAFVPERTRAEFLDPPLAPGPWWSATWARAGTSTPSTAPFACSSTTPAHRWRLSA